MVCSVCVVFGFGVELQEKARGNEGGFEKEFTLVRTNERSLHSTLNMQLQLIALSGLMVLCSFTQAAVCPLFHFLSDFAFSLTP
jgi:hypothetical protein